MAKRREITALVRERLQPYFNHQLPANFGRSTLRMVLERLRTAEVAAAGVADEVLVRGCEQMMGYLREGGTAPFPESLYQATCCEVLRGVLEDRARGEAAGLMRLLDGQAELGTGPLGDEAAVLARVREAIDHVPEPFQRFLRLDFTEARSEAEIRRILGLRDHEEYLHLKRLSLVSLRQAIERLASSRPLRVMT